MSTVARIEVRKKEKEQYGMEPKKFLMWIFLVTVSMLFAAFTSAMVVRRGAPGWLGMEIPSWFMASTVLIVLSSISMQWAYFAAKKNEIDQNRIALWITIALGIGFGFSQYEGWKALTHLGFYFSGNNPTSSFFYAISGIHLLHIVGGIFFLISTLFSAYRYRVHSKNMLKINMCATYWHFIGGLWVYLFIILNVLR